MNNIYKSKWSEATQTWVACSELVRGKTKNNCVKIAASVALALTSLGSYAADAPCNINTANSVIASGTETECSLSDGTTYTEISASGGATLTGEEGKTISATGTPRGKKVINVNGGSKLTATNITTTSKGNSADASALAIAGNESKVTIDRNLVANSYGNSANVIANSDGSELNANGDIIIEDKSKNGFTNGIKNDNSKIVVGGNIEITSDIANSNSNSSIDNINGGRIEADNININQGDKNYAIHQTSENSSITVKNDLNITSGNIPEGNSAITIEGGDITVGGKTDITTHVDSEYIADPKNVSAISITNGTYKAGNGANIQIQSKNEDDKDEDFKGAAGIILGDQGHFINNGDPDKKKDPDNNGVLKVNGGNNTVIATDSALKEDAFFENGKNGTTTSNVDTVVHNSDGKLHVTNDGKLISESDEDSVLKNNQNGIIDVTNHGSIAGNITNTKDGDIYINNSGNIQKKIETSDNTQSKTEISDNTPPKKIENSGTGLINITNTGTIDNDILNTNTGTISIINNDNGTLNGSITNTGDKIKVNDPNAEIPANIFIDNKKNLNGNINNDGNGSIVVNNNTASSVINGNITNAKDGNIAINNSGKANSSKITNSNAGKIDITNNKDGNVNSEITNENTGAIKITNDGTISGSITNTGNASTVAANNIDITNNGVLNSDINNKDKGTIAINNSGTANSAKITNSNAGKIDITNNKDGNVNSEITNENTGAIKITNDGTISGSITNTGNASTVAANNIDITNNGVLNSDINNKDKGTIAINNSGTANSSKITNSKDGKINIINTESGKFESAIIDNDATSTGMITLNNQGTVNSSTITNQNTGAIKITNDGTLSGSIKNTGNASTVAADNIDITNNNELTSSIENNGTGSININNAKNTSNITGNISNQNTGTITLDNNGKIASDILNGNTGSIHITNNETFNGTITNTGDKINDTTANILIDNNKNLNSTINNNGNGYITVNNNNNSVIKGGITNSQNGSIAINNYSGSIDSDIDNDATSTGMIILDNQGTVNSTITNKNTGAINIANTGTIGGYIENKGTGRISLTNNGTINGSITNTGDKGTGEYNIEITNNKELNGSIKNEGTGDIHIKNTKDTSSIISRIGRITGEITNNNAGTIILDNDGEIANAILNGGAGAIKIANNGTLNGSITNTGDKNTDDNIRIENNKDGFINGDITNSGAGNISITNEDEAVLNSNINNDGSGSIIFTNNGDVDANVVNNNPSVRINDTSLRQIQNTGNGKITIINNKTLNRPISNTSGGIIDITNNSSMETDITNNTESSEGGITFKNKQEFKGKLINANSGSISATNTGTFTGVTTNSGSGILDLDNKGIWNNTGNSVLTKLENKTGTIIFPQVSEVNAGDKDQYHTITVNGNYTGGGLMRVNTVWNKDGTSYSDRVDIHGDVDGAATTVRTLNEKGIYGDVTLKEIPIHSAVVVHVAGKSSGNDFTGSAPTTNAGEAQLKKIDTTSGTDYAWTLTAQPKTPDPVVPVPPGPTVSDKPVPPAPPIKEVPIYAEPVSGYVQMPAADMELGFTTVGTLHERRGENQTYNITGSNNTALGDDQQQTWGRVLVKHLDKDGKKRLDTAGNQSVLQIGHDFILDENEKTGTRRHIGGYVAYGHNENDFRDEYRAKNGYIVDDHYTGKGRTDAVSVGGYGTFYGNNGGYVDLVGQVTYLRNKYNARSNESVHQNGWGAALSAETGKSFIVYGNNWFVEPQAQLVYQYLSLDDFNDRIRHVDQHDPSALRGRVGMRFGYNGDTRDNLPSSSFYGIANIWHDFVNPKSVDIGRDSLKEEYAKTWGELGLGIQLPITRQSDFYSDIRYEKNFGSDKRKGFKGTMGYKYTWL